MLEAEGGRLQRSEKGPVRCCRRRRRILLLLLRACAWQYRRADGEKLERRSYKIGYYMSQQRESTLGRERPDRVCEELTRVLLAKALGCEQRAN
jgi:hypothetical protein